MGQSRYGNHGERVVVGQRLMQAATDIFLGWERIRGLDGHAADYYIRGIHDWKGGAGVENLGPSSAAVYARLCEEQPGACTRTLGETASPSRPLGGGDIVRPGHRRVLRPLRGPERGRLRGVRGGRERVGVSTRWSGGVRAIPARAGAAVV